jgi:hypothetical protein
LLSSFDPARSRTIALEAARRLASLIDAEGRFLYRYDTLSGAAVDDYNLTRHVGAVWATAITARRLAARELLAPLNRAMGWLIDSHAQVPAKLGLPVIAEGTGVELGCMALGLLALLEVHRAEANPGYLDLARRFADYIVSQAEPSGEFHHRLLLSSLTPSDHRARYATAQSILALAELAAETGEQHYLDCALESESALARKDFGVREHGHWVLYAINALAAVAPDAGHRAHAGRVARAILVYPLYRDDGLSNPLSCNSEALAAYLALLRRAVPEAGTIDSSGEAPGEPMVRRALEENLSLLLDYRLADGGFVEGEGRPEVQIDHIQHAMSAYLGHALLYGSP